MSICAITTEDDLQFLIRSHHPNDNFNNHIRNHLEKNKMPSLTSSMSSLSSSNRYVANLWSVINRF